MISFNMNNYNSNVVESDTCPNMRYDLLYKSNYKLKISYIIINIVILVGDMGVGKSSLNIYLFIIIIILYN